METRTIGEILNSQESVIVQRAVIHKIGLKKAAILGCLVYESGKSVLTEDGYFWFLRKNFTADYGFSQYVTRNAFKVLVDMGYIHIKKGMQDSLYCKILKEK